MFPLLSKAEWKVTGRKILSVKNLASWLSVITYSSLVNGQVGAGAAVASTAITHICTDRVVEPLKSTEA